MKTILQKQEFYILGAILLSVASLGPSPEVGSPPEQKSASVAFFVSDRKDRPISDVKQSDLTLLDNKQPVRSVLSLKRGNQSPLRLGLLFDSSNSEQTSGLYQPELKAASELLNQVLVGPDDRVFIVKFSAIPEHPTEFMNRVQLQSYKLDLRFGGATALFDAVGFACKSRMDTDAIRPARRVLILLSDGGDNLSHINHDDAIAAAQQAGTVVFAVSTKEDSPRFSSSAPDDKRLKQIAETTGGEAFLHLRPGDVEKSFSRIREQIENMYAITFDPPEPSQRGFHPIELKFSGQDKARVRAPKGYYVK